MPSIVPPPPFTESLDSTAYQQFFEILRKQANAPIAYTSPSDPGVAGVPDGTYSVWINSSTNIVKLWFNQGGVMKSVTLS